MKKSTLGETSSPEASHWAEVLEVLDEDFPNGFPNGILRKEEHRRGWVCVGAEAWAKVERMEHVKAGRPERV